MTSPVGGGSEHVSRYRALGEFDSLVRAAREARRALRELREEESKLNAQSLADDRKLAASKQDRAKAERDSTNAIQRTFSELSRVRQSAGRAGADAGREFTHQFGIRAESEARVISRTSLDRMTRAIEKMFKDAGDKSGNVFASALTRNLNTLNSRLAQLRLDPIDLDVSSEDARQELEAIEFQLKRMANESPSVQVRFQSNEALRDVRRLSRQLRDELGAEVLRDAERVRKELEKIDALPSGRSFRFWALTALSDMSRVFSETDRGVGVFGRLRNAMAAAGGGGSGSSFIRSFVSGFDDLSEASSKFLQRLGRVSGELYRMPGIIAVLVSALPALIAGFGALVGGAGGLVSALGSLSGFLAAGPGLMFAFATGVGAVAMSFGGLGDTLKAAQKAQQEQEEAQEKARLGTEKALTATQKYQAMLRAMGPATKTVVEGFIAFTQRFAEVSDQVQERAFKEVVNDLDSLNRTLPIINDLFGQSATAIGKLASEGIRMITSGPWRRDFQILARANAENITNMGEAGFGLANAFRNIAVAAIPFTRWVTQSIRDGAESFADWSAQARSNGSIQAFLAETSETGQTLWQILKNLGNTINSFFKSTVDEGQSYLRTLDDITGRWADVAKAQEAANSPLRQWMERIRPVLSAMGALIGDLARGIAALASDQRNIDSMIDLLNTLRTDVLPPILRIIQQLNDSGIAVTVVEAFGSFLEAISDFLDSGATTALTVFVTVLANFAELIFSFASLPVISDILGGLAASIAALAAVSIVARFTGLFRLWDFFTWMSRNRGNLAGAFADAARGVAGLQTQGPANIPSRVPSSVGGVGSEVLVGQARATEAVGQASQRAATQAGMFSRALSGIRSAGTTARGALSSLTGFLGGPWGLALIAATTAIGVVTNQLMQNKQEAEDTRGAFIALKNAYGDLKEGNESAVSSLVDTDEKLREIINQADAYGLSLTDVSGALNNQEQSLSRFNAQIDVQIASLTAARDEQIAYARAQGDTTGAFQQGIDAVQAQIDKAEAYKNQVNSTASAQENQNRILNDAISVGRTYQERLAGMTQAQVDNAVMAGSMQSQIQTLSSALDTMASATSSTTQRSKALSDIINHETGEMERANEAAENWSGQLLNLREAVDANGRSLSIKTREGLRNRDALQAAAKATRELYLQDIASGRPMDESIRRHQARIKELREEARRLGLGKKATDDLIKTYGDVPESVKTDIISDEKGFAQVYADLMKLQVMQKALQEGKSLPEAQRAWNAESSKLYQRPPSTGDGYGAAPGFATGGPVWGAGTRNSDSIRAWLSNGEFVQPTDAVEYYGLPLMEALRQRKLDKTIIKEALPDDNTNQFKSGGVAHSANCVSCASGGHKFARGGGVGPTWPFEVDPSKTKIDRDWVTNGLGDIGSGGGPGGWRWQMAVLRQRFPNLPLISGYRPGSRTLSGNRSYHSLGRAVDLHPSRAVASWIRSNYGARTKELITPFQDLNLWNGRPHRYTGAVWNQHNWAGGNAHVHWAYNKGGLVDLMNMMGMNNMVPNQTAPLPSVPRTLSPAASNVVNNTTDNGTSFGDIIINNPAPERGGDSIRNALYRTQLLL